MAGKFEGPFEPWFDKCVAEQGAIKPPAEASADIGLFRVLRCDGDAAGEILCRDHYRLFTVRQAAAKEAFDVGTFYEVFDVVAGTWTVA